MIVKNNVRKPSKINTFSMSVRIKLREAQVILNNYGMYLLLECGQRLKESSRKTCRGRIKLTTKGNLRCSVCRTRWMK